MMRARHGLLAAALAVALVGLPATVTPAQAATTARALACYGSSLCNEANLPILVEAGLVSGGGATAATGGTAALAATGAAGTTGFATFLQSGAAISAGLLLLTGLGSDVSIRTDAAYEGGPGCVIDPAWAVVGSVVPDAACAPGDIAYKSGAGYAGTFHLGSPVGRTVPYTVTWANGGQYPRISTAYRCMWGDAASGVVGSVTSGTGWNGNTGPVNGEVGTFTCSVGAGSFLGAQLSIYDGAVWRYHWLYAGSGIPAPGYHGTIRTTLTCTNSAGSNYVMQSARVDVAQGEPLPVPPATCDPGSVASAVLVEYQADGTTLWVEIGGATTPGTVVDLPSTYPDCFNGTVMTCKLQLQRTTNAGVSWEDCGPLAEYCPTWVAEWSETPSLYRCKYGNTVVSIDLCSAYRKPGMLLPNHGADEDEDGSPDPLPPTTPVPQQLPNPVRDPDTGEAVPLPGEVPGSEQHSRECWPSGFGIFNPLSWVLMPIRCAFEPSPEKVQQVQTAIRARWEASTPGVMVAGVVTVVGSITAAVAGGTGCEGVTVPTGWLNRDAFANAGFPASFTMLNACEGSPLQPWAAFSYWVICAAMVVLAVRVLPGLVGKLFNFGGVSG